MRNPLDNLRGMIGRRRGEPAAAPIARRPGSPRDPASRGGAGGTRTRRADREQTVLARLINHWWNRLLQAVYRGSLSDQEAIYESHSTKRDYVWNTVGTTVWGTVFPVLTIVSTQLVGAEQAGMFSMAFVLGTLLMIATGYGLRTYQVSDIDEQIAFSSYQMNRFLTGAIAVLCALFYCTLRDYGAHMATICIGVCVYKLVDGVADVYEGRLQQADKLYLAGISQTLRSAAVCLAFSLMLLLTRSLGIASLAMAAASVATLVLVTAPLALLETERSRRARPEEVASLFHQCFPLFAALFLFNLTESVPKFVMEGALTYDNQLFFNVLYFPAQGILLTIGFVYKPQLLRLAGIWANPRKRLRFDLIILAVMGVVLGLTAVSAFLMGWIGIPLMSFFYGVDFERFRTLALLMVLAGGITAAIDFLYAIITVVRRQRDVMKLYLSAFCTSIVLSVALIRTIGLTGAVVSYLATMTLLLVLLAIHYARIRRAITRERNPFS